MPHPPEDSSPAVAATVPTTAAWLVPISGPPLRPVELNSTAASTASGLTIGRQESCDIRLPNDAVSRTHARLRCERGGAWRLADLGSRWGTFLNGCRVQPDADLPLQAGDLIRISPWTFNFSASLATRRTVHAVDDVDRMHTLVRSSHAERVGGAGGGLAEDRLALLLEAAASLHGAADESVLAEALLDAACRGSGLPNAAVVRPVDDAGRIELLAARPESMAAKPSCSRSLLAAATATGQIAEFSPTQSGDGSHSIIQMRVDAALCVPLMLGQTAAAFLYLDARGGRDDSISPRNWNGVVSFCLALGRVASLALANLKRVDMERRAALIETELRAAAEAQRWILPRRHATVGALTCFGESRPGRFVGGDFFDIIPLDDGRVVLALGDVAGKGIPASILMTAAQGFLHAALAARAELSDAVGELNRYLAPRRPDDRFVTLWAGVIDPSRRVLRYIDAGHGYAMLLEQETGSPVISRPLDAGDSLPLGVNEQARYVAETVALPAHGQLLVVSDGIIEQPAAPPPASSPPATPSTSRGEFGVGGVRENAAAILAAPDPLKILFEAVIRHAGSENLADDATVLLARW